MRTSGDQQHATIWGRGPTTWNSGRLPSITLNGFSRFFCFPPLSFLVLGRGENLRRPAARNRESNGAQLVLVVACQRAALDGSSSHSLDSSTAQSKAMGSIGSSTAHRKVAGSIGLSTAHGQATPAQRDASTAQQNIEIASSTAQSKAVGILNRLPQKSHTWWFKFKLEKPPEP